MTDNEIIKWWEDEIHLAEYVDSDYRDGIKVDVIKQTVDLIKRQKEEIEILNLVVSCEKFFNITKRETVEEVAKYYSVNRDQIKSEAIHEFAERLKNKCHTDRGYEIMIEGTIDNLVKEMTE